MPARTERAAIEEFRAGLGRMAGCVTDHPLSASPMRSDSRRAAVSFAPFGSIARLRRRGGGALGLFLRCDVEPNRMTIPRRAFEAKLTGYAYQVADAGQRELLAFHWHPVSVSPIAEPHLHLTSRLGRIEEPGTGLPISLGEIHIPTGFVMLAAVVRLLIDEFGVEPQRANWQNILACPVHPLE